MNSQDVLAGITSALGNILLGALHQGELNADLSFAQPSQLPQTLDSPIQLNLYLYRTEVSSARRNEPLPAAARNGESAPVPLPLQLWYLLSVSAHATQMIEAHRIFARALLAFHDHPVLEAADVPDAELRPALAGQTERIRIVRQPLNEEELTKLWSAIQSPLRLSASYLVSTALIESGRPTRTPKPVLRRGPDDRGPVLDRVPFGPFLEAVDYNSPQPAIQHGKKVLLRGRGLAEVQRAQLRHTRTDFTLDLPVVHDGDALTLDIPPLSGGSTAANSLPAGASFIKVLVQAGAGDPIWSNELLLSVAPIISFSPSVLFANGDPDHDLFTVSVWPAVQAGQRLSLLLGDREIRPSGSTTEATVTNGLSTKLTFLIPAVAGKFLIRIRVDGVDSIFVIAGSVGWEFDPVYFLEVQVS